MTKQEIIKAIHKGNTITTNAANSFRRAAIVAK